MIYLAQIGLMETQIGLLFTLTLIGDTVISLWITTHADHWGRRRMLIAGSVLMVFAGVLFAVTRDFVVLLIAATIGVISPSGNEVGPFLPIEQASLSQIVSDEQRTQIFSWYNLVGSMATALGALIGGVLVQASQSAGLTPLMPNLPLAIAILLLRFSISQMDDPTRQSHTMAVVSPDERSAAAGITGIARTTGASLTPVFTGPLFANALLMNAPFFISGGLKILYNLLLYHSFRNLKPPEEKGPPDSS